MSSTQVPSHRNGAASGPSTSTVHTGPSLSPDRYRLTEANLKELEERFHGRYQLYTRLAKKYGTPPKKGNWSENARTVIAKRIVVKDKDGNPSETPEEMAWRVALAVACAEADFLKGVADSVVEQRIVDVAHQFYDLMVEQRAFPNSPTLTNAGKPDLLSLAACFVLPVEDSLDKIFDTVKYTALIHKSGGGCVDGRAKVFTTFCGVEDFAVLYQRLRATGREPIPQGNGLAMDVRDLNIRTLSQNPDTGRFEMGRISHVWSFDVPREEQRQVVTQHGSVITSSWHPFMVLQGGRLVEKRADELKPGDILLRSNRSAQDSWPITEEKEVAGRRLTPDLAWLLGYFQGDGSLAQAKIGRMDNLTRVSRVLEENFGTSCAIQTDARGLHSVTTTSREPVTWVQDALGMKHGLVVPDYIYKSPLPVIRAYLAGLVDSDGTVDTRGRVSVTMAEEALIRGVYHLVDLLGFEPAWRERAAHGKGKVPVYQVTLSSLDKIEALRSFLLPELTDGVKKERLQSIEASREFSSYDRIPLPFEELAPLLEAAGVPAVSTAIHREAVSVGGESFWLANFKEGRGIGRNNLRHLVAALRRTLGDSPTLDLLESIAENATVVVEVNVPEEKADLYDFTVEGHSTYVASGGEFISIHNTGFNFSYLRPKGARVGSTGGVSSGPVSFMSVIGAATESVKQGGCVAPETLVSTSRGIVPIRELGPQEAEADSWHAHKEPLVVATDDGPRASDEFYNHGVAKVRRIRTRSGYHLTATLEHRIRVINEEGHYVWRHLADLKPGDWAVLQKGHMLEPADMSLPQLARAPHFNATPVTLPGQASEQLGEFIGYVIGDGAFNQYNAGATTGRLILTVADKQPDVAEWVIRTSRELFGITPLREKKENDGSTNFFLNATTLVSWLRQLGVHKASADMAQVPDLIFRKGASMARGFLRGLFTADGTVSKDGYPSLSSVSADLVDGVQQLLLAVGIPSSVSVVTNRVGAFGSKPLHRLRVTARAGIEAFAQQIGFIDAERNAILAGQLQKAWEFNDVIPNQEKLMAEAYAGPGRGSGPMRGSRGAALAERHEEIRNSPLAHFLTADQFYDQIESIEEAESLTLDLSVPANNTYIANGFISHNTRRGANMGMLRIDHPDILEFIESKRHGNRTQALTNFNISVLVPDSFMEKLKNNEDYELIHPKTGTNLDPDGRPLGTLNSREIWDKLVHGAWETGDPGVVFVDRLERDNPTPHIGRLECTNPCFHPDTLIATERGLERIEDLYKRSADGWIWIATDNRVWNEAKVVNRRSYAVPGVTMRRARVIPTGTKPTVEVRLSNGQFIKVTPDHRILTTKGWREAENLQTGDEVLVQSGSGSFAETDTIGTELGTFLGWLTGDGWMAADGSYVGLVFGQDDEKRKAFMQRLKELGIKPVRSPEKRVPASMWTASRPTVTAFLSALFAADGTVNHVDESHRDVRLTSASEGLLKDVQLLLLNLGVYSRIYYRGKQGVTGFAYRTEAGEERSYQSRGYYELIINGDDVLRFAQEVGIGLHPAKSEKLAAIAKKSRKNTKYTAKVISVTPAETVNVYDIQEPVTHSLIANGMVCHNCGEQPLLPFEACNLGSINVAKYVVPGQDGKKVFDLKRLAADSRIMVRFLDDVIQSSWYALPEIFDVVHGNRKIGVGVMGYGDALIDMEIPYDSEEAMVVAEELMKTIHLATVEATQQLAKERGAFPNFKGSVYDRKGEPPRRNALTTTIAPTGTIGLLADAVCAGVEPLFAVAYMRTTADGIRLPYVHPRFEAVARQEGWYSPELMEKIASIGHVRGLPEVPEKWQKVFVTAHEVTPEWHVRTQAVFQKWTDNAVSKTVNFANEAQPADVERVYMLAYELNCKGVTIFRDGSLDSQVLTVGTKASVPAAAAADMPTAGNGMQILPGSITRKMEIPDERSGYTRTLQTPLGKMYITVNEIAKGLPIEVFTTIGKAGSDITADAEAIGRLISLVLQLGGHISLVTHTLRGIGGSSTVGFGPNRVTSMADAIAKFLEQKYLEEEEHGSGLSLGICPECGKAAVVPEMGCATCKECGWKAC